MLATLLGLAGNFLVFLAICVAINKLPSLLLPSLSEERQDLFSVIVAFILTAVVVTTPWDTYFSIAGYLLKTVWPMLLLCLLFLAIFDAVKAFVTSPMVERYMVFTIMFTYTVTIALSKVLRMPSNSTLEIVCLLLFWALLWGSITTVAEKLVPSATIKSYPVFTAAVLVALMFLGTRMLWVIMSWSTPTQKPTALTMPSASTLDSQMNIMFTAIQEMKAQLRDMGKMLDFVAWMVKIPIFVFVILIAAIAWMIKYIKENLHELINTCAFKVTAFAKDSLGWRWPGYKGLLRVFFGPTDRIWAAAGLPVS